MDRQKNAAKGEQASLLIALEAFQKAESGEITPSELAGVLREVLAGEREAGKQARLPVAWGELKDFVDIDLSDYAYSLAIHDQPAIDGFNKLIAQWRQRLEKILAK